MNRSMARNSSCSQLVLMPANSALQRTGKHKVLGRGRPIVTYLRALARPRADALACRR
jgi:hypothetical protein